ncbi:MAG: response regulator [Geobacteraceae bacterium]|jgi:CheY-like chemotaxis protein
MTELSQPILLVEDDPGHVLLIEKNLRRAGVTNEIIKMDDGGRAVEFLFKEGEFAAASTPMPLLILLDLNLPVLNGLQVLQRIKADERTRRIPVVMLTTTDSQQEITRCYDLGCNIYIVKPVDYVKFSETIRNLGLFLSTVKTPDE